MTQTTSFTNWVDEPLLSSDEISELFTAPVFVALATADLFGAHLPPEEAAIVSRASALRRREFAAGRHAARAALEQLGVTHALILQGEHREPVWPAGIVGAITHCDGVCGAAVASNRSAQAIGLDVERSDPLDLGVADAICGPGEIEDFAALPSPAYGSWIKVAFSAKEAFYKAYFPLAGTFLEFRDVNIQILSDATGHQGSYSIEITDFSKPLSQVAPTFEGRWRVAGSFV